MMSSRRDSAQREAVAPTLTPLTLGRAASSALYDELALSPKPGLVTLTDVGSHDDMDAQTFTRSLFALRGYFVRMAELGTQAAPFSELQRSGLDAEQRMLAATGGVNTHRGAIFLLGLLCAAGGALAAAGQLPTPQQLQAVLRRHWGEALAHKAAQPSSLPGGMAARRLGLRSAAQEAALGFPVLFGVTVPTLREGLARGRSAWVARTDALFATMAVLDDSNLAHRGGLAGLRHAQAAARGFMAAGGAAQPDGRWRAEAIGKDFVARRLSPGGAADMLSAACWLQRIGGLRDAA